MKKFTLSALLMVLALGLTACSSEESEGVDVEQAADNAEEMMEDAGEEMSEAAQEAADSAEDAYNDATQ